MIRQDDTLLNAMSDLPFKEYGCALMCEIYLGVMWASEREMSQGKGYDFQRETFIADCDNWRSSGALSKELDVNWNKVARDIGLPYRIVIEKGTHRLPPERHLKDKEFQVVLLRNPATGLGHFVVMNKYDQVVYDPLGKSVTVLSYEYDMAFIESRRIFRRIK